MTSFCEVESMSAHFLPVSLPELQALGVTQPDFVYVIGDAYVDHPSFGPAIIGRLLEKHGFSVALIPQPDWKRKESIMIYGQPRLGFLVSAGNMDSMVNHYTVSKKRRGTDSYSPGGAVGLRPDRAAMVYCNLIRSVYRHVPVIAGGIEASLRRLAHYDYWSNSLRRSLLMDCGADLISYGMGERSILEIAQALAQGIAVQNITFVRGTCYKTKDPDSIPGALILPSYDELLEDRTNYARSFYTQYCNTDPINGNVLAEPYGTVYVVQNPPSLPLTTDEMDAVYDLPFQGRAHPSYDEKGGIPAIQEVKFSLVSNRGCFGGCNFCALTFHQGRILQVRSHESILREARRMTQDPDFKGYIHDVGGPTANFRQPSCQHQLRRGTCKNRQCLFPQPCPSLKADHSDYIALLRKLRALPGVKKVFVRSGVRFDYVLADPDPAFLRELIQYHVSGQLKVAPEHVSDRVLSMLGKPCHQVYERFAGQYARINRECGKDQYLVPYFMSSHPGCRLEDAVELAEYLRDIGHMPEQVQDFYPTPSTISTCMYYTGLDPRTMQSVYVPVNPHEKAMQRALMQYKLPRNRELVLEALHLTHREDLIGFGPKCLVHPEREKGVAGKDETYRTREKGDAGKNRIHRAREKGDAGKDRTHRAREKGDSGTDETYRTREKGGAGKDLKRAEMNGAAPVRKKKTIRNIHHKK